MTHPIRLDAEASRIQRIFNRYADLPSSLADACLVRMAEMHENCRVFTLDSHFRIYRRRDRQVIPVLMPRGM
jgi:predicted nucleic acid-binding protein